MHLIQSGVLMFQMESMFMVETMMAKKCSYYAGENVFVIDWFERFGRNYSKRTENKQVQGLRLYMVFISFKI